MCEWMFGVLGSSGIWDLEGKNIDLSGQRDFKGFISKESAAGNSKKTPLFMLDFMLYFGDT